jgi:hypothetical protein
MLAGVAEDLWGFAAASPAAARERDAQLMAEYDACLAASSEIFDKAMWLRLGKVPSKAQGDRPLDRRGGPPTMVQAGQGALLSRLRQQHQQQQQPSGEDTHDAGNPSGGPRCPDKAQAGSADVSSSPAAVASAPRDDSHANVEYEFVMGGGGALRIAGSAGGAGGSSRSRTSSLGSPVGSPASISSPMSSFSPAIASSRERNDGDRNVWLGGDEMGKNPGRRAAAAGGAGRAGSPRQRKFENGDRDPREVGGHGLGLPCWHGGAPMLTTSGVQSSSAVLQRLALLRKELEDKRAADHAGLSISVGSGASATARSRNVVRCGVGADGARKGEGAGSFRGWAKQQGSLAQLSEARTCVVYSKPLYSKPHGSGDGARVANTRLASASSAQDHELDRAATWAADNRVSHSGGGASGRTAPPSRDGDRERYGVAGEGRSSRGGSAKAGGPGLCAARKESREFASLFGAPLPKHMSWGNAEGPSAGVEAPHVSACGVHGAGLFQALEAGGRHDVSRGEDVSRARLGTRHAARLGTRGHEELRIRTPSAPPKLDMCVSYWRSYACGYACACLCACEWM